jgi:hypothetical protein
MTNSEYQELVEFLGRKFEEVDRRFDQTATKEELPAQQAETRRHFDVVAEDLRSRMQLVAEGHQALVDGQQALVEGHQALAEGQERILVRMERMERELGAMIRISYAELEERIRRCEQGLTTVQERLGRVEARQM